MTTEETAQPINSTLKHVLGWNTGSMTQIPVADLSLYLSQTQKFQILVQVCVSDLERARYKALCSMTDQRYSVEVNAA